MFHSCISASRTCDFNNHRQYGIVFVYRAWEAIYDAPEILICCISHSMGRTNFGKTNKENYRMLPSDRTRSMRGSSDCVAWALRTKVVSEATADQSPEVKRLPNIAVDFITSSGTSDVIKVVSGVIGGCMYRASWYMSSSPECMTYLTCPLSFLMLIEALNTQFLSHWPMKSMYYKVCGASRACQVIEVLDRGAVEVYRHLKSWRQALTNTLTLRLGSWRPFKSSVSTWFS